MGTARVNVPLLGESRAYVDRLSLAAAPWERGKYAFRRRINWSHRYDAEFLAHETEVFLRDPTAYLAARVPSPPATLGDVYARTLGAKQLLVTLAKVSLHWAFAAAGTIALRRRARKGARTFRKAYVDDIELVFDPATPGMVRGVFPFPLSIKRQLRYLARARRESLAFALCGHRYGFLDLCRVLRERSVGALMRLEVRAQLRTARWLVRAGFSRIELSDEFDLGSLDFCRALRRHGLKAVNSAHGVGKYLPWHAYHEFWVLTQRQADYYRGVFPCRYERRTLNAPDVTRPPVDAETMLRIVWLSQVFSRDAGFIATGEAALVAMLAAAFGKHPRVALLYKPHPNNAGYPVPQGFKRLERLDEVNGRAGTIFLSFFSTCQIDPAFVGSKVLVRTDVIHPEIAFDASEPIVDWAGLERLLRERLERLA